MLSTGDRQIVARDPHLEGLAVALDEERLTEVTRRARPEAGVQRVQPVYVRYKPGTGCVVGCRVHSAERVVDAYVRATVDRRKLEKICRREAVEGALGPGVVPLLDVGLVMLVHPNDAALPALARMGGDAERRALLERLLPRHEHLWGGSFERLSYKPERRFVGRLRAGEASCLLRFHDADDFRVASNSVKRFSSRNGVRVPALIRRSTRHRVTALEWLDGTPLWGALAQDADPRATGERVGAALAALHAQGLKRAPEHTPATRWRALASAADSAALLAPELGSHLQALLPGIHEGLRQPLDRSAIHGDFSPDQVLVGDRVALLDLDRAGWGDARIDLGSFIAWLATRSGAGELAVDTAVACQEGLVAGYTAVSGTDVARGLGPFVAAAVVMALGDPFRTRDPAWQARMKSDLRVAEERCADVD